MSSLPKKSWLIYFIIIFSFHPVKTDIQTWMKHFRKHFEDDRRFYQIVIFSDKQKPSSLIPNELVRNIPTLRISFGALDTISKNNLLSLKSFGEPRSTTIFILIIRFKEKTYLSQIQNFLDFLKQISPVRSLPKCLFIFLQKDNFNYRSLLQKMWKNRILDITILHVRETTNSENFFLPSHNLVTSVHQYNPFTDVYLSKELVSGLQNWFPNKVNDMNGYQIKAGLITKPPHSFVKRNSTGHPVSFSGVDVLMFQTLAETLNFTYHFPPTNVESLGVINPIKKFASGFIGDLLHHRIHILVNPLVRTRPPMHQLWEYSGTVDLESLRALVPILPVHNQLVRQELYLVTIFFVLTVIFIWIVSRILRFDPHIWQGVDIAQVLMGNSACNVPLKSAERIFFASVLLVSFINVSVLYGGFTSYRMIFKPEKKFESFKDLDESGLTPIILKNFFAVTFDSAGGPVGNLGNKAIKWASDEIGIKCPKYLEKHRNITCLLVNSEAEIARRASEAGILSVKVMKPSFWSCGTAMAFEKSSPYVDVFTKVLMRLTEGGLRGKWVRDNKFIHGNEGIDEDDRKDYEDGDDEDEKHRSKMVKKRLHINITRTLKFIVLYGGSISFVAFVSELVIHHSKKYLAKKREVGAGVLIL